MNSTKRISSGQRSKESQLEDFDLVILVVTLGQLLLRGPLLEKGYASRLSSENIGGSCPNIASSPSMDIIHTSGVECWPREATFGTVDAVWHKSKPSWAPFGKVWKVEGNDRATTSLQSRFKEPRGCTIRFPLGSCKRYMNTNQVVTTVKAARFVRWLEYVDRSNCVIFAPDKCRKSGADFQCRQPVRP
jgi:hypothetical protein